MGEICNDAFRLDFDRRVKLLRNGNVHSVDKWHCVLEPVVVRYRSSDISPFFRGGFDRIMARCMAKTIESELYATLLWSQ